MNTNIYSQVCNPANLNLAYARIRMQTRGPAFDQQAVADYERHLELNLADLALRLREGGYYPIPARSFDSTGNSFTRTMRMIEDLIVQQAVFNAIAPLFEPAFLDCSFGLQRNNEAALAVRQVLVHRARGDHYIVRADISEWPDAYDHDNLIYLLGTQINDQQLLRLIRMWLNCGQALPWPAKNDSRSLIPTDEYPPSPIHMMVMQWLDEIGNDRWNHTNDWGFDDERNPQEFPADFKKTLKRLGVDAARITLESSLLVLASNPRYRHFFTKRNIALASAAALAAAAYPAASQLLREKSLAEHPGRNFAPSSADSGLLGGPLAGLLTDIVLHRFDVAMTGAGLRLVRLYDKFAITATREAEARYALDLAASELRRMDIPLNPQKAHIERFEEGVEFLGYCIHPYENVAELIVPDEPAPFTQWRQQVSDVIRRAPAQLMPAAAQIGGFAKDRLNAGYRQIKSLIHPNRNNGRESFRDYRK